MVKFLFYKFATLVTIYLLLFFLCCFRHPHSTKGHNASSSIAATEKDQKILGEICTVHTCVSLVASFSNLDAASAAATPLLFFLPPLLVFL